MARKTEGSFRRYANRRNIHDATCGCIGERLERRLLERLVETNDHEWTADLIDRLLRSKLLIKKTNQDDHQMLAFAHPMCRLALVQEMSPELRVKTHEDIAEALTDFDDVSARIAYHLFQAGRYAQGAEATLESLIILFTENERNWVESAKTNG